MDTDEASNLYTIRPDGSPLRQISHEARESLRMTQPTWLPDGSAVMVGLDDCSGGPSPSRWVAIVKLDGTVGRRDRPSGPDDHFVSGLRYKHFCVTLVLHQRGCPVSTMSQTAPSATDGEGGVLLRRYGIDPTDENRATLAAYVTRTRRSRWWGVVGAFVASGAGLFGFAGDSVGQGIAWIFAGYLVGSAVAEALTPVRAAVGTVHTASLAIREPNLFLPVWARALPWVFLLPCLVAPLLLWGDHQTGVTRVHDLSGRAIAQASWFSSPALIGCAVVAAAALAFWWLTLRRLARRRLPVDGVGAARLDLLTRALSARAMSGAAAALGLSLLAGLAFLGTEPLMSRTCTSPSECHYLYGWHDRSDLLQNVGGLLLVAAILVFWLGRLPRVDTSLLRSVARPSR